MSITVHSGSILESEADCIVNPANSFLNHGGGLAAIIDRAAQTWRGGDYRNTEMLDSTDESLERIIRYKRDHRSAPLIATGDAYATSAGMLPYKAVIHAVGPIWAGGGLYERALLGSAYGNACAVALDNGWHSIAFPAISAGIFGFPMPEGAQIAIKAVQFFATRLGMRVEFWPFGFEEEFNAALA